MTNKHSHIPSGPASVNPNQNVPSGKGKYSAVQYFFWMIAGSEISVLKNCPTDYNRHASIGFTILMTCVFAGFAGYLAGYSIGGNSELAGAVFGAIWAFLIFSIDRSLVVSLKKDPTASSQPILKFLVPRAILAALVAFIISIPLETKVFEEEIVIQMRKDKVLEKETFRNNFTRAEDIAGQQQSISNQQEAISKLDALLNAPCPTQKCNEFRTQLTLDSTNVTELLRRKNNQQGKKNAAWNKVPFRPVYDSLGNVIKQLKNRKTSEWRRYITESSRFNSLEKQYNTANTLLQKNKDSLSFYSNKFFAEKESQKKVAQKKVEDADSLLISAQNTIKTEADSLEKELESKTGFIRQFDAMENAAAADNSLLFFLWLIRCMFFVIELLPTIVKIFTPIGEYDQAIHAQEQHFKNHYDGVIQSYYQSQLNKQHVSLASEENLHRQIVDAIRDVQLQVANVYLNNWKVQHIGSNNSQTHTSFNSHAQQQSGGATSSNGTQTQNAKHQKKQPTQNPSQTQNTGPSPILTPQPPAKQLSSPPQTVAQLSGSSLNNPGVISSYVTASSRSITGKWMQRSGKNPGAILEFSTQDNSFSWGNKIAGKYYFDEQNQVLRLAPSTSNLTSIVGRLKSLVSKSKKMKTYLISMDMNQNQFELQSQDEAHIPAIKFTRIKTHP